MTPSLKTPIANPPSEQDRKALGEIMDILQKLPFDGQKRVLTSACAFSTSA